MVSSVPLAPTPPDVVDADAACCANVATQRTSTTQVSAIRTLTNSLYAALRRRGKVIATAKNFLTQS